MQGFRRAAVTLALAAMALRALVPAGWMPNPQGLSETAFIICDMGETDMAKMAMSKPAVSKMGGMDMSRMDMSKAVDASAKDQAPAKDSGNSRQHEECPFAAAPHLATPSVVAMLPLPALADGFADGISHDRLALEATHYAPQSPRAPPRLA
jgi:hypothetical protein